MTGLHMVTPPNPVVVPPNEIGWADLRLQVLAACALREEVAR